MVSDSELVDRIREILRTSDLNVTTPGTVRRQLQVEFGVDLSDRKKFITEKIDEIIESGDINVGQDENVNEQLEDVDVGKEEKHEENEEEEEGEAEDEAEEEEEVEEKSGNNRSKKNKKRLKDEATKDKDTTKKKKANGFTKLCSLSTRLQEFFGVPEMARTEVVKNIWAYIKENDLQDPTNRRNIKCDEKLRSIFGVDTINMFQMNKALSKHVWPLESEKVASQPSGKKQKCSDDEVGSEQLEKTQKRLKDEVGSEQSEKKQKRSKDEVGSEQSEKKQKRSKDEDTDKSHQKATGTGFMAPLQMSEAFVKFLGTGETTISRSGAVKRIWDYIKQNQLQDPSDKRQVLCDEKLKELFEVDTFRGFAVTKHLTAHLTKLKK
ncbi:unnamed protein product [Amaranthus hypochondriacus]